MDFEFFSFDICLILVNSLEFYTAEG